MRFTPPAFIFIGSILLSLSSGVIAESQFSLALSLLHFDYTEFDPAELDSETGWIPGLQLQLDSVINQHWSAGFELAAYDGNVDYDGQTQSGVPHTTTTDEKLTRFGARFKTPLNTRATLVVGVKHHEWERDINDNNGVYGGLEIYRWWEISAGIVSELWSKDDESWQLEVSLLKTHDATLHVDLSRADYGKADLDLGNEWGGRFQLSWTQRTAPDRQISVNLFHEIWDFGRSEPRATTGGSTSLLIYEPRSETRHTGVQLLVGFNY